MPENPRLVGMGAVVTGASSGIGRAVALGLAQEGARVVAGARRTDRLEGLAKEAGEAAGEIVPFAVDVRDEGSVDAFAAHARRKLDSVDILFNNAGIGRQGRLIGMSIEDWDDVMATNVRGVFLVARAIAPLMVASARTSDTPALIVNVASVAGKTGIAGLSAYSTSKHAVRGFSESIGLELADENVRVVALNPGYVATDMTSGAPAKSSDMMRVEGIRDIVVFLATLDKSVIIDDMTAWPFKMYAD